MTLIAILVSLAISRTVAAVHGWRRLAWFVDFAGWAHARMRAVSVWNGPAGVFAIVAPVVFVTGWLYGTLSGWLGLFGFLFAVLVLAISIGPDDVDKQVEQLLDAWERDDGTAAEHRLAALTSGIAAADAPREALVVDQLLAATSTQLLGILFWFTVLGPMGAIVYRLSSMLVGLARTWDAGWRPFTDAAEVLHGVLDWLPARLTALGYAITGSFVDALHLWRNVGVAASGDWVANNRAVVIASGRGALQLDTAPPDIAADESAREFWFGQLTSAQALTRRTVVLWLAMIAILTLAGWTR
jgi:membrane protein required for beta-lactamase induction